LVYPFLAQSLALNKILSIYWKSNKFPVSKGVIGQLLKLRERLGRLFALSEKLPKMWKIATFSHVVNIFQLYITDKYEIKQLDHGYSSSIIEYYLLCIDSVLCL
jgi:predicted thioredoxin/glutaredoxin